VLILLHGRGASAAGMLSLFASLELGEFAALALQAAGNSWYPQSFLAPIEANQPYLDSALSLVESTLANLLEVGIASRRIALFGFSQGACLTLEYIARHPRRYGGVAALTGGLIGPDGTPRAYSGTLAGTPILLAAGDPDPHVPFSRVLESREVLTGLGAEVELRRYPGMPHTINDDELAACRALLLRMLGPQ
jgi:predicted esterase